MITCQFNSAGSFVVFWTVSANTELAYNQIDNDYKNMKNMKGKNEQNVTN